jgi:hypothetical protein
VAELKSERKDFGMRDSSSFIIEPYIKAATVRSPLGFMSQATYWAQLLFPGITVLTRHFFHVELLLRELRRRRRLGDVREKIEPALRSRSLHRRLEREYMRYLGEEPDAVVTKVTYWQRYGSMFDYFGLWRAPRGLDESELWQIVFASRMPEEFRTWTRQESPVERRRRISDTRWYLRFQKELAEAGPDRILWWITGDHAPSDVSAEIRLSRRLSYAFLVWQTLFEVGIRLTIQGIRPPRMSARPLGARQVVDLLVAASRGEPGRDELKEIFAGLLSAHSHQLAPVMATWQRKVEGASWYKPALTRLYDGTEVRDLAKVSAPALFGRLVELHQYYCRAQGKTDAEFIRSSKGGFVAKQFGRGISASFASTPGGLFGYRLDQAVALYQSARP